MDKKQRNIALVSGGILTAGAITGLIMFIRKRNKKKRNLLISDSSDTSPSNSNQLPSAFRNWEGGSTYLTGSPRGIRNNNPGNLIRTSIKWQGKLPDHQNRDSRFEMFISPEYGIRAMIKDLKNDIDKGKKTVPQLIEEYAPRFENSTDIYIDKVCKDLKVSRNAKLLPTKNTLRLLVFSISKVENGGNYMTNEMFDKAYAMSGYA